MQCRRLPSHLPIVQCAANFSEGRRQDVVAAIAEAASAFPECVAADVSADPDHNRMVLSLLGAPESVLRAVLAACEEALRHLELRSHAGAHPRVGVADVIPFTPIRGASMDTCRELALRAAHTLWHDLRIPVYLYEHSARPHRPRSLPEIRKRLRASGTGLPDLTDLAPDFGEPRLGPGGAAVVGARDPLVAYNVFVAGGGVDAARHAARVIRQRRNSCPEIVGVRALGLELPSRNAAQVSMNLTQPYATPIPGVFAYVADALGRYGGQAGPGEVVGLVPRQTLGGCHPGDRGLELLTETQVIENWLETAGSPEGVKGVE